MSTKILPNYCANSLIRLFLKQNLANFLVQYSYKNSTKAMNLRKCPNFFVKNSYLYKFEVYHLMNNAEFFKICLFYKIFPSEMEIFLSAKSARALSWVISIKVFPFL